MRSLAAAIAAVVVSALSFSSANAAAVVVDPWQSSGNGTALGDNFGGVPNMDLLYRGKDGFGASPDTSGMYVWALWDTLYHVAYTNVAVADVFLRPDVGWLDGVSLYSFDIGSYLGALETSEVRVYNGDYSSLLFQHTYNLSSSAVTVSPELSSLNGLHIQFSGTPGYMAIDNITVEAGQIFAATVPEPAAWALMIGGFGLAGAALRRRRAAVAA
jgi:hypothetical protein